MVLVDLTQIECPECHILFWISKVHNDRLRESKETFYCPNGHRQKYPGKSDFQKYKEEKENAIKFYDKYVAEQLEKQALEKKFKKQAKSLEKLKKGVK